MVEFALTGIPLLFFMICVIQMAIGMWHYHTIQYAVKQAGAYLTTHGSSSGYCKSNTCQIQNVSTVLQAAAIGLPSNSVYLTFTPISSSDHTTTGTAYSCRLDSCVSDSTAWPASGYNSVGSEFSIKAEYQYFHSMGMVSFGQGIDPIKFGNPWFPGYTHQAILY
jgi:hypothetical protein